MIAKGKNDQYFKKYKFFLQIYNNAQWKKMDLLKKYN